MPIAVKTVETTKQLSASAAGSGAVHTLQTVSQAKPVDQYATVAEHFEAPAGALGTLPNTDLEPALSDETAQARWDQAMGNLNSAWQANTMPAGDKGANDATSQLLEQGGLLWTGNEPASTNPFAAASGLGALLQTDNPQKDGGDLAAVGFADPRLAEQDCDAGDYGYAALKGGVSGAVGGAAGGAPFGGALGAFVGAISVGIAGAVGAATNHAIECIFDDEDGAEGSVTTQAGDAVETESTDGTDDSEEVGEDPAEAPVCYPEEGSSDSTSTPDPNGASSDGQDSAIVQAAQGLTSRNQRTTKPATSSLTNPGRNGSGINHMGTTIDGLAGSNLDPYINPGPGADESSSVPLPGPAQSTGEVVQLNQPAPVDPPAIG